MIGDQSQDGKPRMNADERGSQTIKRTPQERLEIMRGLATGARVLCEGMLMRIAEFEKEIKGSSQEPGVRSRNAEGGAA